MKNNCFASPPNPEKIHAEETLRRGEVTWLIFSPNIQQMMRYNEKNFVETLLRPVTHTLHCILSHWDQTLTQKVGKATCTGAEAEGVIVKVS